MPRISVIAPTKNETTTPGVVRQLFKVIGKDTEVIVVDKSEPRYRRMLDGLGAKVVTQKHGVYEHALNEGFLMAHGDYIASIDPDGTYSVKDLKMLIDYAMKHREYAWIGGDRMDCSEEAMPFTIKLGNRFFGLLASILTGQWMRDTYSGIFVMRRDAYDKVRNLKVFVAGPTIWQMALSRKGYRLHMLKISYAPRVGSKSKTTNFKPLFGFKLAANMIAARFSRL